MLEQALVVSVLVVPLVATLVFAFLPERKESPMMHKRWRIAFIVVAVAYTAIAWWQIKVSDSSADRDRRNAIQETSDRVAKEVNDKNAQTIDDLKGKINTLQDQLADAQKEIKRIGSSNIVTGKNPVKVEVTNGSKMAEAPPAVVQHVHISQRQVPSTRDDAPYGLEVTLQTDVMQQPTAFVIECDADITEGSFYVTGSTMMTNIHRGVLDNKKQFYFSFGTPPFTPQAPIVVTLLAKTPIKATRVMRTAQ